MKKNKIYRIKKNCQLTVTFLLLPTVMFWPAMSGAQSNVGSFSSVVTIQGPVNQTATGSNVKQDLNVGSAQKSTANTFNSVVTTGAITQTGENGAQQFINVGGMNNSSANKFDANVNVGRIEQIGRGGERQEIDIGSVTNSTVSGTASTRVDVKGGVRQTGSGEIVLGAVKNANVGQFESNLSVRGRVDGQNIRMGSVVGRQRYDNEGNAVSRHHSGGVVTLPFDFESASISNASPSKLEAVLQFVGASTSFGYGMVAQAGSLAGRVVQGIVALPSLVNSASMYVHVGGIETVGFLFRIDKASISTYAEAMATRHQKLNSQYKQSRYNPSNVLKLDEGVSYLQRLATHFYENTGNCLDGLFKCDTEIFKSSADLAYLDDSIVEQGNTIIEIAQAGLTIGASVPGAVRSGSSYLQSLRAGSKSASSARYLDDIDGVAINSTPNKAGLSNQVGGKSGVIAKEGVEISVGSVNREYLVNKNTHVLSENEWRSGSNQQKYEWSNEFKLTAEEIDAMFDARNKFNVPQVWAARNTSAFESILNGSVPKSVAVPEKTSNVLDYFINPTLSSTSLKAYLHAMGPSGKVTIFEPKPLSNKYIQEAFKKYNESTQPDWPKYDLKEFAQKLNKRSGSKLKEYKNFLSGQISKTTLPSGDVVNDIVQSEITRSGGFQRFSRKHKDETAAREFALGEDSVLYEFDPKNNVMRPVTSDIDKIGMVDPKTGKLPVGDKRIIELGQHENTMTKEMHGSTQDFIENTTKREKLFHGFGKENSVVYVDEAGLSSGSLR